MSEFKDKFVYESCDVEGADVFNLSCEILEAADKKLQTQAEIIEVLMGAVENTIRFSDHSKTCSLVFSKSLRCDCYLSRITTAKQKAEKLMEKL